MVTLVIGGEEAPDYNSPVVRGGRHVGKLTSPSAGRSPTVDRLIGMACIEEGTRTARHSGRRHDGGRTAGAGDRRPLPHLRPRQDATAGISPGEAGPQGSGRSRFWRILAPSIHPNPCSKQASRGGRGGVEFEGRMWPGSSVQRDQIRPRRLVACPNTGTGADHDACTKYNLIDLFAGFGGMTRGFVDADRFTPINGG